MRNTGIEYSSTERTPMVLPEMAELLPPLTEEQLAALETDLLKNGCYSPVIVNEELVIIDGHNRQMLCEKHGIPYKMAVFSFEDMLEAKQWALDNQKGRQSVLRPAAPGRTSGLSGAFFRGDAVRRCRHSDRGTVSETVGLKGSERVAVGGAGEGL